MTHKIDDDVIFSIHRHPFGLISLYLFTLFATAASYATILWATNELVDDFNSSKKAVVLLAFTIGTGLVLLFLAMATKIYWSSYLMLTNEEVKQSIQKSLFHKTSSRLGLANVEDVTAVKKGVLSTLFNFGTLNIETAGEQSNFNFKYCPDPEKCAKEVMEARQTYMDLINNR